MPSVSIPESKRIGRMLKDKQWVKRSFLIGRSDLVEDEAVFRYFTTAALKFNNTSPGGAQEINPLPQFTRNCDISPPGPNRSGDGELGIVYSEVYDDNAQRIHMRFGVPNFNSLTTFFSGFYNVSAGRIARTGRGPGLAFTIGKTVGMVVPLFFPVAIIATLAGYAGRFFLDKPSSKYYSLKPTMPLYWHAVQTIVNMIAVNRGIVPRLFGDDETKKKLAGQYEWGDQYSLEAKNLHKIAPDIFTESGSINVHSFATKYQRLERAQQRLIEAAAAKDSANPLKTLMSALNPTTLLKAKQPNWDKYIKAWYEGPNLGSSGTVNKLGDLGSSETLDKSALAKDPSFLDFYTSEVDDGSAWVTFRVNYTGTASESFSNSVGDPEIKGTLDGMSAKGRQSNFNFMGGNIDGGMIDAVLGATVGAAKNLLAGFAEGVGVAGLGILAGGAFVDIPKIWQSSMAQLNRTSYTMHLAVPYNNPICQFIGIDVPLAMILAAALPLSTGRQSYTSPFLCEIYDRGRAQTRLGIIESLSITRGTGNMGFMPDGTAMGIDVNFTVADLSSVMHMPITSAFNMNATDSLGNLGAALGGVAGGVVGSAAGPVGTVTGATTGASGGEIFGKGAGFVVDSGAAAISTIGSLFDDETVFTDYMAVLSGMGLRDQIYKLPKLKMRLTRVATDWDTWLSSSNYASIMADSISGRLLSIAYTGTAKN